MWLIGPQMNVIEQAAKELGIDLTTEMNIEDDASWRHRYQALDFNTAQGIAESCLQAPDWLIITSHHAENKNEEQIQFIVAVLAWKGLKAVLIAHEESSSPNERSTRNRWGRWLKQEMLGNFWGSTQITLSTTQQGGAIEGTFIIHILAEHKTLDVVQSTRMGLLPKLSQTPKTIAQCLYDPSLTRQNLITSNEKYKAQPRNSDSNLTNPVAAIQLNTEKWWSAFPIDRPAPNIRNTPLSIHDTCYIQLELPKEGRVTRELLWQDLAMIIGHEEQFIQEVQHQQWPTSELLQHLKNQPPKEIWRATFTHLLMAEQSAHNETVSDKTLAPYQNKEWSALLETSKPSPQFRSFNTTIDRWTTIPLPTHRKWADETAKDRDLALVGEALMSGHTLDRHRVVDKRYHNAWDKGQLEIEDGVIFHTEEPRLTDIRQLRRRVTPPSLRQIVITAYHATPLAGHSGAYRTYWRVAARYWWPNMYSDVRTAIATCAHCRLANAVGHEAQTILTAISSDTPFDVIAIDVWSPGDVPDKDGNIKAITSLDTMTGFASVTVIEQVTSEVVARQCFAAFFVPNGLPKLILVDAGSENKGALIDMCTTLGIKYHAVSPEDHNGILCERFHRYLNKVQKIVAADSQSFTQWAQGLSFAAYSWNAAPIDGTNIIRSFAAKSRVFPFPIQIAEEENPVRIPQGQGEAALAHLETNFPLWARQATMLQILIADRRKRHRELQNQGRTQRTFNIGDLVIIRKQVKSDSTKNAPAKQQFKWKGMYRILEAVGERSYKVQKLPTLQGNGRPGKLRQYSAAVMERVPSSMVVNKHLDTTDTRMAALETPLTRNPLEQSLGFHQFGRYVKAPNDADFAFDRIEDLWSIDVESDSDDEPDATEHTEDNLQTLYETIRESKDKLFIIKLTTPPQTQSGLVCSPSRLGRNQSGRSRKHRTIPFTLVNTTPRRQQTATYDGMQILARSPRIAERQHPRTNATSGTPEGYQALSSRPTVGLLRMENEFSHRPFSWTI